MSKIEGMKVLLLIHLSCASPIVFFQPSFTFPLVAQVYEVDVKLFYPLHWNTNRQTFVLKTVPSLNEEDACLDNAKTVLNCSPQVLFSLGFFLGVSLNLFDLFCFVSIISFPFHWWFT